jgi:hypothetical protein
VRGRSHRTGLGAAALAAWVGLACADPVAPGTRICAEILALQVSGAESLETWPGPHGVALDYRVPGEDGASVHRIECLIAEPEPGRLRAHSLRIDGRELSEAELLLVNSELLLAEMRRADRATPRPPPWAATLSGLHAGAVRMQATLARLARDVLSSVGEWGTGRSREGLGERGAAEARV